LLLNRYEETRALPDIEYNSVIPMLGSFGSGGQGAGVGAKTVLIPISAEPPVLINPVGAELAA